MIQNVQPLDPGKPTMVGEAFTLRYMPAREDLNKIDVFRDRAHPQRKAIEDCPPGAVLVMDSRKDARAASAGAILVTRLMQRGCARARQQGCAAALRRILGHLDFLNESIQALSEQIDQLHGEDTSTDYNIFSSPTKGSIKGFQFRPGDLGLLSVHSRASGPPPSISQ